MKGKLIKSGEKYRLSLASINDLYWTFQGTYAVSNEYLSEDYQLQKLSLKNCQAIENGYDLDELAREACNITDPLRLDSQKYKQDPYFKIGFNKGFQKALEIFGDKKFSEEQMKRIYEKGYSSGRSELNSRESDKIKYDYIQSLQPTEWDVTIEVERSKFISDKSLRNDIKNGFNYTPKLDADGCLILKRK